MERKRNGERDRRSSLKNIIINYRIPHRKNLKVPTHIQIYKYNHGIVLNLRYSSKKEKKIGLECSLAQLSPTVLEWKLLGKIVEHGILALKRPTNQPTCSIGSTASAPSLSPLALLGHEHSFFSGPTRQPSPCRRLKYIYSINAFEKRNLRLIVDAPQGGRSLKNYKWNERRRRRRRRRRSEWWRCPYTSVTVIFLLLLLLLWLWWLMMMTWRAFETLSDCWCCIGIFAQSGQSRLTFFSFV